MSKSKGNVVNPDEVVDRVGADTLRVYEMFMGPFDQAIAWNTDNMVGSRRWLERVWRLSERCADTSDESVERMLHETIKKVSADIEEMKFNTAVAQMMACVNKAEEGAISHEDYGRFIRLLAPFAPHITEEIWRGVLGHTESVHSAPWPQYDEEKLVEGTMRIAVQIDGKVRAVLTTPAEESEETIKAKAQEHDRARQWIADRKIVRVIYVPGKLVSIVTEGK